MKGFRDHEKLPLLRPALRSLRASDESDRNQSSIAVPAQVEGVIEGQIFIEELEAEEPFSDLANHLGVESYRRPVVRVTTIAHRQSTFLFTSILVGLLAIESNNISRAWRELIR